MDSEASRLATQSHYSFGIYGVLHGKTMGVLEKGRNLSRFRPH
jgi:hypothetical protein